MNRNAAPAAARPDRASSCRRGIAPDTAGRAAPRKAPPGWIFFRPASRRPAREADGAVGYGLSQGSGAARAGHSASNRGQEPKGGSMCTATRSPRSRWSWAAAGACGFWKATKKWAAAYSPSTRISPRRGTARTGSVVGSFALLRRGRDFSRNGSAPSNWTDH